MSKKANIIKGLRELVEEAVSAIEDMPDSVLDAIEGYDCEGESNNGAIKLKLAVVLDDDKSNK